MRFGHGVVRVQHDAVNTSAIEGVVGLARPDPGVLQSWKQLAPLHVVELVVAENVVLRAPEAREELFQLCGDKTLFVVSGEVDTDFSVYGVRAVVVVAETAVIGIFPPAEFPAVREKVRQAFQEALQARGIGTADEMEVELEV